MSEIILPTIIIDTREQSPLSFKVKSIRGGLDTGDYSYVGGEDSFAVERKSIPDLVGSVASKERDRFERELLRLRGYHFKRVLIVGSIKDVAEGNYRSRANPKSVLHSTYAFEVRYEVPFVWAKDERQAAWYIETWATWHRREMFNQANSLVRAERRRLKEEEKNDL